VAGQRLDADDLNDWMQNLPWGLVDEATRTSNVGTFTTTPTDLTGLTITWTAVTNRQYLIEGQADFTSSVAGDDVAIQITTGADSLVQQARATLATVNRPQFIHIAGVVTPSAGSATYKLKAARSGGTGNITMSASATNYAWMRITDIGPA
jgi:hypothetical protein